MNDETTKMFLKMILINELTIIEFLIQLTNKIVSVGEFTEDEKERVSKTKVIALNQMKLTIDLVEGCL